MSTCHGAFVAPEAHEVGVRECNSPITGRTFQPVCSCGYRGGHYKILRRAEAAARETRNRLRGLGVTAR